MIDEDANQRNADILWFVGQLEDRKRVVTDACLAKPGIGCSCGGYVAFVSRIQDTVLQFRQYEV